jgi:hypothetical protein
MKHLHHIVPKHAGGTNDSSNLVELSVKEHAKAHRLLWEQYGRWQDKIAWKTLSGQISIQEAKEYMMKHQNPMFRDDVKQKMSGENHWSKKDGNIHNWVTNNPMNDPDTIKKMSGENHWSKRPGKIHNAKVNHPKGSSKKISVGDVIFNSIREASKQLNMDVRKIKKIGKLM